MRWRRIVGILLMVLGCAGFATVADDLRHTGELFGVGGILMAGAMLFAAGSNQPRIRRLALHRVAAGLGVGLLAGAAIDRVPMCVACGGIVGALGSAIAGASRR